MLHQQLQSGPFLFVQSRFSAHRAQRSAAQSAARLRLLFGKEFAECRRPAHSIQILRLWPLFGRHLSGSGCSRGLQLYRGLYRDRWAALLWLSFGSYTQILLATGPQGIAFAHGSVGRHAHKWFSARDLSRSGHEQLWADWQ